MEKLYKKSIPEEQIYCLMMDSKKTVLKF